MKLSLRTRIAIDLAVKWRRFKEWLHRPVCWVKSHCPTMLQDEETIYCERCGKVLGSFIDGAYVKKGERVPSAIPQKIVERGFVVGTPDKTDKNIFDFKTKPSPLTQEELDKAGIVITDEKATLTAREEAKKLLAEVNEEIRKAQKHTGLVKKPYIFHRETSGVERISKEEAARKRWLPEPTTRRRTRTRTHQPPAERHRGAISKHMGKHGGRSSKGYRRTVRESASIPIEEEDD